MHLHKHAGRRTAMVQAAEAGLAAFERADWAAGVVALRRELACWSMAGGDSGDAARRFQEIAAGNWGHLLVTNELIFAHYLAAENSYRQDHLEEARAYQQSCMALVVQLQDQELIYLARCMGGVLDADGAGLDVETPVDRLDEVRSRAAFEYSLDCRTRSLIAAGQPDLAWQSVQEIGRELQRIALISVRRSSIITYLRAYLARGIDLAAVTTLLAETLALARAGENRFDELHLLALQAWQQFQLHDSAAATATLRDAARLVQETGYVRVLLDIPDLAPLLRELRIPLAHSPLPAPRAAPAPNGTTALTAQELRVLKLLAADYTYDQIGVELVLSIGTVRTHVRHIYKKLGVHRRDQAIAAAQRRRLMNR